MIVPCYHHNQAGTHSWEALRDWFEQQSWTTQKLREEFREGDCPPVSTPHAVWVRPHAGRYERMADSTRRGHFNWTPDCKLEECGWRKVLLWDLTRSVELYAEVVGLKCRSCDEVLPLVNFPHGEAYRLAGEKGDAVCGGCDLLARQVVKAPTRRRIEDLASAAATLSPARAALRRVMRRAAQNGRKSDQDDLKVLCKALGVEMRA